MQCPSCGAFISEKDVFCGECGRPLPQASAAAKPLSPTQAKDLPTVDLDSLRTPPPPVTRPARKSRPVVPILLAGAGPLVLFLCGVVTFILLDKTEEPAPISTKATERIPFSTQAVLPSDNAVISGALIYQDDFDDPTSGWDVFNEDDTLAEYADGEYRLAVYQENYMAWSNPSPGQEFGDFVIEVDARQVEGPLDNNYGLVIRDQGDEENFYWYEISSDGYYSVDMMWAGEWATLVSWKESGAVNQGLGATNRLKVACSGSQCRFYVNDTWLTDVSDNTFPSGNIGLAAGNFDEPGVVVHFDNLRVYALDE